MTVMTRPYSLAARQTIELLVMYFEKRRDA
jgi:hypothetical protein